MPPVDWFAKLAHAPIQTTLETTRHICRSRLLTWALGMHRIPQGILPGHSDAALSKPYDPVYPATYLIQLEEHSFLVLRWRTAPTQMPSSNSAVSGVRSWSDACRFPDSSPH